MTEKRLVGNLKEEKNMHLKGGLYHLTQIKLAYNSNRIEGSQLSEDQTRYIYETNTIFVEPDQTANVDDITETINHFRCFDFMIDHAGDILTEELIKQFHAFLKRNTADEKKDWFRVGDYKLKPNMIGDLKTTAPSKVKADMNQLLKEYCCKEKITFEELITFHYRFECIHPFQDGNGRVGRIILFKECLKNDIMPFIIDNEHKLFYYRGLKEFEQEKGFLMDTCLSAQDDYKKIVSYFSSDIVVEESIINHPML